MPAIATITQDLIVETAEELVVAGAKVTTETVRAALLAKTGVGGSHGTIAPILTRWKKERVDAEEKIADVKTPVPQALISLRERNQREEWALAVREAAAQFDGERQRYQSDMLRLEEELSEALGLADHLQGKLDALEADHGFLSARAIDAEGRAVSLGERAQVAEARNQELSHRIAHLDDELGVERTRVVRLQDEVDGVRGELRQALEAMVAAKEEMASLRTKLERASDVEQVVESLNSRLRVAESRNQELDVRIEGAGRELSLERERALALQGELTGLRGELRQAAEAMMAAKEEAAMLRGKVEGLQTKRSQ